MITALLTEVMTMNTPITVSRILAAASVALTLSLAASPAALAAAARVSPGHGAAAAKAAAASYIVQAGSLAGAKAAVRAAGGSITHELGIIDAVAATLSPTQVEALRANPRVTLTADGSTKVAASAQPYVVRQTTANLLHAAGITGKGVTIAFLDTGVKLVSALAKDTANVNAVLGGYDATKAIEGISNIDDVNGHGTHITSIAVNGAPAPDGTYTGVAPDASRVFVTAFDGSGAGTYANAIRGLDWILANRTKYKIRVVNLSFGATVQSSYWNDPLNRAVMKLWQAGIVVVASAGNWGPYAQSITAPGNVPYVITVGAMTDNYTPTNAADDRLASFSSTGPTYEGFVKPEIVAPGGHVTGLINKQAAIPTAHPEFLDANNYFYMSGTSMSAAVVSGVVALMLQAQPTLTPNQVKCKLMSSARAAVDSSGKLAYTVFQQGAGQINAYAAVLNPYTSCGNAGLDIAADLAGTKHYGGPARQKADGTYYVVDATGQPINQQGYVWNNGYAWNQGYVWNNGYLWNNGYIWSNGYLWNNGYVWNNGYLWNQSFVPSTASVSGINHWVDQE